MLVQIKKSLNNIIFVNNDKTQNKKQCKIIILSVAFKSRSIHQDIINQLFYVSLAFHIFVKLISLFNLIIIMQKSKNTVILTPTNRVIAIIMIIAQIVLYVFSSALLFNYHSIVMPFLPFESLVTTTSTETHYLWNLSLYMLFWLQHIVMATLKYKKAWSKVWHNFPLFERYIYNILSGVCLITIFYNVRPSNIYLFTIPNWICLPLNLYGLICFVKGMIQLGQLIFMPYKISQLLNNKQINYVPYETKYSYPLKTTGLYGLIRHPIQAGLLFMMLFGYGVYTVDRLIFVVIMNIFILIGVYMEERRLKVYFTDYLTYMEQVKSMFVPYLI